MNRQALLGALNRELHLFFVLVVFNVHLRRRYDLLLRDQLILLHPADQCHGLRCNSSLCYSPSFPPTYRTSRNNCCSAVSFCRKTCRMMSVFYTLHASHSPTSITIRHHLDSKQYVTPFLPRPTGGSWKKSPTFNPSSSPYHNK